MQCGKTANPGKPHTNNRSPRICGRMCQDIGSKKTFFTFKRQGDCFCQEDVDSLSDCATGTENLYRYEGNV